MSSREELRVIARALKTRVANLKRLGVTGMPRSAVVPMDPTRRLRALEQQVITCTRCPLYRSRTHHVFGDGDINARLVFVGEAPGREEDLQGKPFVGAAGRLLTKMIEAMGLRREEVYICNVLKDRPPNNRIPQPDEIEACRPYLLEQLAIIQPQVICTLGAIAAKALLGIGISITRVRGQRHEFEDPTGGYHIPVIPTFHPAYLLRNPDAKKLVWKDLKRVKQLLTIITQSPHYSITH